MHVYRVWLGNIHTRYVGSMQLWRGDHMTQVLTTQAQTLAGFWGGEVAGRFCMIYREQKVYKVWKWSQGQKYTVEPYKSTIVQCP